MVSITDLDGSITRAGGVIYLLIIFKELLAQKIQPHPEISKFGRLFDLIELLFFNNLIAQQSS